jgi:hypothetical protein
MRGTDGVVRLGRFIHVAHGDRRELVQRLHREVRYAGPLDARYRVQPALDDLDGQYHLLAVVHILRLVPIGDGVYIAGLPIAGLEPRHIVIEDLTVEEGIRAPPAVLLGLHHLLEFGRLQRLVPLETDVLDDHPCLLVDLEVHIYAIAGRLAYRRRNGRVGETLALIEVQDRDAGVLEPVGLVGRSDLHSEHRLNVGLGDAVAALDVYGRHLRTFLDDHDEADTPLVGRLGLDPDVGEEAHVVEPANPLAYGVGLELVADPDPESQQDPVTAHELIAHGLHGGDRLSQSLRRQADGDNKNQKHRQNRSRCAHAHTPPCSRSDGHASTAPGPCKRKPNSVNARRVHELGRSKGQNSYRFSMDTRRSQPASAGS